MSKPKALQAGNAGGPASSSNIFEHSKEMKPVETDGEVARMPTSVYTTPVVPNDVLYISDKLTLYAIVEAPRATRPLREPSSSATANQLGPQQGFPTPATRSAGVVLFGQLIFRSPSGILA